MKKNFYLNSLAYQINQIDFSVFIDIIKPIIVFYMANKTIKTYKLQKDFTKSPKQIIQMPPNTEELFRPINKERILKAEFGSSIMEFATTLIEHIPKHDLGLFYYNLHSLTTKSVNFGPLNLIIGKNIVASYNSVSNTISAEKNSYLQTIDHELLHLASSIYYPYDGINLCGFAQVGKNSSIGRGLNEGYTQALANRYFGHNKKIMPAYPIEQMMALQLEKTVGQRKMESLYFHADLHGLIEQLKKYEDEETVIKFINDFDFISKYTNQSSLLPNKSRMLESKLQSTYDFVLGCYIKKNKDEADSKDLDADNFTENIKDFIESGPITLTIGNNTYNIIDPQTIYDKIDQTLNGQPNTNPKTESSHQKVKQFAF